MPKIIQLSPHVANLIAAGEVVERPASVAKELLENAVDAGATKITLEIRGGGMTFLRVTDNGCGMSPEDARTAFLRHATSKLRGAEDLAAIGTMGFRGEALAAIASVSRIDLLTKTPGAIAGTSLRLEAGQILEQEEAGCPDGTTIIIRDLFYNTPARMKFMKSDTVEGSRIAAAVQMQALAHPDVAIQFIRDGKQVLSTPGKGGLEAAVYCVYGRDCAKMVKVDSRWEGYSLTGFVSRPTDARPSRGMQTFFVNDRPVKSKLLVAALEEAYRNQLMQGRFPACVLHLTLPPAAVDVNVHPAKTEIKFLSEKAAFDCVHYGVLGALNKQVDRPQIQFRAPEPAPAPAAPKAAPSPRQDFFKTMTPETFRAFTAAIQEAPQPRGEAAAAMVRRIREDAQPLREEVLLPKAAPAASGQPRPLPRQEEAAAKAEPAGRPSREELPREVSAQEAFLPEEVLEPNLPEAAESPEPKAEGEEGGLQQELELPAPPPWRMVGELYRSYILVEQGEEAFLIDKHAAHERILFEKLKANQEAISRQCLLTPLTVRLGPAQTGELLANRQMLEELGFVLEEFGDNTLLLRQIPMDLSLEDAAQSVEALAADLLNGRRTEKDTVRDQLLHTVACKAAIKAGWNNDEKELLALVEQVMSREDLKYCPHGRPICVGLSKKLLEKQFRRT